MKTVSGILRDRERRFRLFSILSIALVFLLPVVGWDPMLALWLVHLVCLYRETPQRPMRVFYGCMMALALGLILLNVFMRLSIFFP